MKEEIEAAVNFITKLIGKSETIDQEKIDQLSAKLCQLLHLRFRDHWFPDKPVKGQAYRCIRINELDRSDPTLEEACKECDINYDDLKLPIEMTLWVDPEEVTCRFGEHKGSYCVVAKIREGSHENYLDTINIDELEQKSRERSKQASYDIMNGQRNKRQNGRLKNGLNMNYNMNGFYSDYTSIIPTTSSPSTFYPFYPNGSPFTAYGSSPPNPHPNGTIFNKYPISPPQQRALNSTPGYRGKGVNGYNAPIGQGSVASNTKYSRNLNTAFNNMGFSSPFGYPQNDRYHYFNKSINGVKA